MTSSLLVHQSRPTAPCAALGRTLPACQGRSSFLSAQHWWDTSGVLGPVLRSPVKERLSNWSKPSGNPPWWLDIWNLWCTKRLSWDCPGWRTEGWGGANCLQLWKDTEETVNFSQGCTGKVESEREQVLTRKIPTAWVENVLQWDWLSTGIGCSASQWNVHPGQILHSSKHYSLKAITQIYLLLAPLQRDLWKIDLIWF